MASDSTLINYDKFQTVTSCAVGHTLRITRPLGYPPVKDAENGGFRILYPKLGSFINIDSTGYVDYLHENSGTQVIEYISNSLGHYIFSLVIQGVLVHDHASMSMGGPAFATYFSDIGSITTSEE